MKAGGTEKCAGLNTERGSGHKHREIAVATSHEVESIRATAPIADRTDSDDGIILRGETTLEG